MKENDFSIDEVFDTRKSTDKSNESKAKKHKRPVNKKIFIICGIVLALIIAALIMYFIMHKKPVPKENLVYTEFDPLITKLDDETFYIFGAKRDTKFEVVPSDNFSYQILDEEGNEISTNKENKNDKLIITAPNESYKEGQSYTIKINNGTFASNDLKEAKKIVFSIARPAANNYTIKDTVITLDNPKIENNKLVSTEEYKENDIIVATNKNKVIDSYKITKVNSDGTYDLTNPQIGEVFDTIDYYGMEKLNLSAFATNEELKNYLINTISKHILDSLVDTVYAKESIEIKEPVWNQKTQSLSFSVIIDAKENTKLFESSVLKNHQANVELYINVKANLYKNVTLTNYDYALSLEYTINNKININSIDNKIIELNDNIRNNKKDYDATWLLTDYSKIVNDKVEISKSLGNVIIQTDIPNLSVSLNPNFIMNTDLKAIINGNASGKIITTAGINSKKTLYGNIVFNGQGDGTSIGDGNIFTGFALNSSIKFLNMKLDSNLNTLAYIESKADIKEKDNNDDKENKTINYEIKADIGYNINYNLTATIDAEKLNKKIFDNKKVLKTYEKQSTFTKQKEQKEETNKYTAEEVREKLKTAYNEIGEQEEWTVRGGAITVSFISEKTIDVDNNKLINTVTYDGSTSYTCNYDYLNKTINCDNFESTQNYIKNACDILHDDYLNYLETGEADNEDAIEWENLYDSLDSCYYETITKNAPTDYKEDFDKILNQAKLSDADLEVLK